MSLVGFGNVVGWNPLDDRISDLETNLAAQEAQIQAVADSIVAAYYVAGRGSGAGQVVASGALVRVPLPGIFEKLPNNADWSRNGNGIYDYGGNVAGTYSAKCIVNFGVSLGVLQLYTFHFVEGTDLLNVTAIPDVTRIRDSCVCSLERAVNTGQGSAVISGPLILQPTGGQIALLVQHNSGLSVTITPGTLLPFLHRIDPVPVP